MQFPKRAGIWLKRPFREGGGWSPTPAAPHLAVAEEYSQKSSSPTRALAPSHALAPLNPVSTYPGQGELAARGKSAQLPGMVFGNRRTGGWSCCCCCDVFCAQSGQDAHPAGSLFFWLNSPLPIFSFLTDKYDLTKIPHPHPKKSLH